MTERKEQRKTNSYISIITYINNKGIKINCLNLYYKQNKEHMAYI